jgi:asparagine synthase (glutamine-hydrolysing)
LQLRIRKGLKMCGIFGAINIDGFFEGRDFEQFCMLNDLTSYRGPNDRGVMTFSLKKLVDNTNGRFDVFLGNRRLSILDLSSNGHQPMTDHCGHWIAYNGEVFNFVELRRELESKGHEFSTGTDTEVILHIYSEYGEQGFDRFNGMWALAIADIPNRRVVLSRDRFSIKPLYLLQIQGCTYFASEIKQLLPLLPSRRLNVEIMSTFLGQGLLDHCRETFFEGIVKAVPRANLVFSLETGRSRESTYWDFCRGSSVSERDITEHFRELFLDSVNLRLRSDVKVGVLLSGGLDSSSIAVVCKQIAGDRVETYSIVSEDGSCDEHRFIDKLVNTGVVNRKIVFGHSDAVEDLDQVLYHNDEPVGGFSVVAQFKLFRTIKQATASTVLLSGQGGDEVLLGYLKFFFFYLKSLCREAKYSRALLQLAASIWQRTIIHQFTLRSARRYIPSLAARQCRAWNTAHTPVPVWECSDMPSRQMLDIERYSVPALTHYEDRNSMAHSLEVRHPFLDHRLLEFLVNIPSEWKIRNGWTKYVLRQALPELPNDIRWRRDKQGFLTPEQYWLKNHLQPLVRSMFHNSRLRQAGVLNELEFLRYYHDFQRGAAVPHTDIARAIIAERWMRQAF